MRGEGGAVAGACASGSWKKRAPSGGSRLADWEGRLLGRSPQILAGLWEPVALEVEIHWSGTEKAQKIPTK